MWAILHVLYQKCFFHSQILRRFIQERDPFNQNSDLSDQEKWSTSKGAPWRDPFNQNFRKFRSKTQWIGSVQPEKFRKNGSTTFPGRTGGILVQWIAPPVFSKLFRLDRSDPYPGYQRFFSRAVGIFGVGRRPTHLRP